MVNSNTMAELERLGFGSDVDALESYVSTLQDAAGYGNPLVDDSVYDTHVRLLKQLKPDSQILNRNWETADTELDEYDELLREYGMCSITTLTSYDDMYKFKALLDDIGHPVRLLVGVKENGHGVRAVYSYGHLHNGSTRGRYKKGRDITRHLKAVLPEYVDAWKDIRLVEVRGEMLVSKETFETYLKGTLKNPLSSVTSLIRESATDEELQYLDMVCYKVLVTDDSARPATLADEYRILRESGFKTPEAIGLSDVTSDNLEESVAEALEYFENLMDEDKIAYSCDGLVFSISDNSIFYSSGKNGNAWNANFALKMGRYWESNVYSAEILDIQFIPGKSYIVPKAIIDPVKSVNGAEITNVPLYNIGVMERYHYIPGETIYFRFGGEVGVTLCDVYGKSVRVNG